MKVDGTERNIYNSCYTDMNEVKTKDSATESITRVKEKDLVEISQEGKEALEGTNNTESSDTIREIIEKNYQSWNNMQSLILLVK